MKRIRKNGPLGMIAFAVLGSAALTLAADPLPPAAERVRLEYPGLRIYTHDGRVRAVYGRPMTEAATPAEAAQLWWERHAESFGVGDLELRLAEQRQLGRTQEFTVQRYDQFIDGVPVEFGGARLLVRNDQESSVVYVGAKLAREPPNGFLSDAIAGDQARSIVRSMAPYAALDAWTEPQLVVFHGDANDGPGPAVRAWRFTGGEPGIASTVKYTFFVDAATGELVHVRDEIARAVDLVGHVGGNGSPGVLPDVDYNLPVELDMPEIEVTIVGGAADFTDRDGDYVLPHGGTDPVTAVTGVPGGRWVTVVNQAGSEVRLAQQVTPPGPADFLLNAAPEEFATSQINGFVHVTEVHNFFKDRQPDFDGLDVQLTVLVNSTGACDAFFQGASLLFLRAGSAGEFTCPNSAYSTIIAHEYGHFIHSAHAIPGGSFTEGFADTISMLHFDTPIMGADLLGAGASVRDYSDDCEDYQYPCTGALPACGSEGIENNTTHACGKLIGGVWWKIKQNVQQTMGDAAGLEYARQLLTDWTGITNGGQGLSSAHPQTVVEVLTVDDDNGDLVDGTPHDQEICAAFAAHGIYECPGDAAGQVPDGDDLPGSQLMVGRGSGGELDLSWAVSCQAGDVDFAVYEGTIGDFASHVPNSCSTSGATSTSITPAAGSNYYLVVPLSSNREGSYGTDGGGLERRPGSPACLPQSIGACGATTR